MLSVLVAHVVSVFPRDFPSMDTWAVGRMGVLLFFVHTSLVLMSSLERQQMRTGWVRSFFIRRAFRIYPLAAVTALATGAFTILPYAVPLDSAGLYDHEPVGVVLANAALVQNVFQVEYSPGVLWTLPVELNLYLMLPIAFLIARKGVAAAGILLAGSAALGATTLAGWTDSVPGLWRIASDFWFAPCFMAGVLAYSMLRTGRTAVLPAWTFPLALALCVPVFQLLHPTGTTPARAWPFCIAVALVLVATRELRESRFTRAAHHVCTLSYGLYLLHLTVIWLAFAKLRAAPTAVQWAMFLILIVLLPFAAYRMIEKPMIGLGRRLTRTRDPIAAEVAAP